MMSQHIQIGSNIESPTPERVRATPVRPAVWMTSVLAWATVVATFLNVPMWVGIFLCSLTGLSFLSYLVPYIYLMVHDREVLRRERFHLKGSSTKQLVSIDTAEQLASGDPANEKLIADPGEHLVRETQRLERK